jgi:hypothetical protein
MTLHAKSFSISDALRMMKAFNHAAVDARGGWQPSLPLEVALAEALEIPSEAPPSKPDSSSGPGQDSKAASAKATTPALAGGAREVATTAQAPKAEATKVSEKKETVIGLAEVVKAWKDIRAVIKPVHPGVEALLNSCKPMDVRGDELILGFQSDTVRALMDKPENLGATRKAIADVLGVSLAIKCVVTNAKGKLPPDVPADGMVAAALNHGGEIVDVQE